jgi:hypothetical protein
MPGLLPDKPVAATRINPKIAVFYGKPKVGKTKLLSILPDCLTLGFEAGAEMYEMKRVRITGLQGTNVIKDESTGEISMTFNDVIAEMVKYASAEKAKAPGKKIAPPYKFLAVDTLDLLEEMAEISATEKYRASALGKKFEGSSVLELPNGGGYYHLRNEVMGRIATLSQMCQYLILVCHVREKNLDKGGVAVSVSDLSLAGKLSTMVAAAADVIGYLYREPGKPIMVSFATSEGTTMGSRFERLAGKTMPFKWEDIYLPE